MKFRFWGVRGSIPSPGPRTVRYGGNTTCIEVRSDDGTLIVLDGGTGLGIGHVMGVQFQNSYFPVGEAQMAATIEYRTLAVGEAVPVGDAVVRNVLMSHPVTDLGYRIDCNGRSVFFTGDHEPLFNPHGEGQPGHEAFARQVAERNAAIDALAHGVDALIVDCSYTREEYPAKIGWGHGTFDSALAMAVRTGAKALYCTHHEPTRSDDELEAVFADVMARHAPLPGGLRVVLAWEGLEVELG